MTRTEHLLTILAEECAEVAQRASKALRFGLAEVQPGQDKTNAYRIMEEMNDLIATYQMIAGPVFSPTSQLFRYPTGVDGFQGDILRKQQRIEKYLKLSQECGTLDVER